MQEDVYQEDGLNLYAYCRNNPVTYYDPSGYGKKKGYCSINGKINNDEEKILEPNGTYITDKYDELAYNGYYKAKNNRRTEYKK